MKNNTHKDSEHHHGGHSHNVFDNPLMFVEKFDGPERDEWQKPDEVIKSFNLHDDAVVIDIGAGTGYFTIRLADRLKNGKIFAFEQAPKMAEYLYDRVSKLGFNNVDVRTTESGGSPELEEKVDLIFSVDVYHHLENRINYFTKVSEYLKPEGVLVVIDRTEGKVAGQPMGHRVPQEKVKEEMKEAGFELVEELGFLLPVQYYLAFKRVL
jgi:cyclopropane fatty-acyl-phospholipid synthase-like methyltransferase